VIFLWRRQQALQAEIMQLRRDSTRPRPTSRRRAVVSASPHHLHPAMVMVGMFLGFILGARAAPTIRPQQKREAGREAGSRRAGRPAHRRNGQAGAADLIAERCRRPGPHASWLQDHRQISPGTRWERSPGTAYEVSGWRKETWLPPSLAHM